MGCAALMIHLRCFPCYYGGLHGTATPGSRGSVITEETWRYHRGMAGYVGEECDQVQQCGEYPALSDWLVQQ